MVLAVDHEPSWLITLVMAPTAVGMGSGTAMLYPRLAGRAGSAGHRVVAVAARYGIMALVLDAVMYVWFVHEPRAELVGGAVAHVVLLVILLPLGVLGAPAIAAETILRWHLHAAGLIAVIPLWLALAASGYRSTGQIG